MQIGKVLIVSFAHVKAAQLSVETQTEARIQANHGTSTVLLA